MWISPVGSSGLQLSYTGALSCLRRSAPAGPALQTRFCWSDSLSWVQTWEFIFRLGACPRRIHENNREALNSENGLSLVKQRRLLVSCCAHSSAPWHSTCATAACDSNRRFCCCKRATHLPSALQTLLAHEIFEVQEACFYRLNLFFFACFRWGEIPLALMQWRGGQFVLSAIDYYFLLLLFG